MSMTVDSVLEQAVKAEQLYHRLLLLVAPSGTGKTEILKAVSDAHHSLCINVNLSLSKGMLDLTTKQRALRAASILNDIVDTAGGDIVLMDNLEVLFDRSLQLDPLRLLKDLSRHLTIVASWNGSINDRGLVYGEPDHPEYRQYAPGEIDFLYTTSEEHEG
jgi:UDP-N-acetylglucosamine transferase subunit ALG13